ncbi:MAG: hypothetical protein IJY67_08810 [Paludibacteraceae bacterium]|nr:hypothetical protein [Paludibacteraceae bacterium]
MSRLYYFNPDHDLALANGNAHFQAPESATAFAEDLSLLPCWFAEEVASEVLSDQEFSEELNVLGLDVATIPLFSKDKIEEFKVEPWGWNLAVRKFFLNNGVAEKLLPTIDKIEEYKRLAHRRLTIDAMNYLRSRSIYPESLPQSAVELKSVAEVKAFALKHEEVVFKAPWSGSGKGVFWSSGPLTPSLSGWCKRIIEKQGSVMGEIAYNRVQDFAMEFKVGRGDVAFAGYSLFFTEGSGIYRGNYLLSNEDIEAELTKWVSVDYLRWLRDELMIFLRENVAKVYTGFVGVDMFVYSETRDTRHETRDVRHEMRDTRCETRDARCETRDIEYRINPVVEFNLRMTMGMVARVVYDRCVKKGVRGMFTIDHCPPGELLRDHIVQTEETPIEIEDGRFKKGYFSLCPITENTVYRACISLT